MMAERYPEIEPFESGMLDVGDGHRIYYERCGNPDGKPALYLHGGPGSGFSPGQRRFFDPDAYMTVLLDQRGSKRSTPLASEPDVDLSTNTTHHLIADIELLRERFGVEQWTTILGISWGTTLALAYAQTHPQRVKSLVLALVATTSRREVEWITVDCGRIFPREWERFTGFIPERLRHLPPVDAYAELLFDPDPEVREQAALEWCTWEDAHMSLAPGSGPRLAVEDSEFRLRFARLVTHYWRHAAFLEEEQLIRNVGILDGIPGVLIHGVYDVSGPLVTAWRLHKGWGTSELRILDDAGHGGGDSFMESVVGSLDRFREL